MFAIKMFFTQEGHHNVTFIANGFQNGNPPDIVEYNLQFEIVGKVRGAKINDFQIITSKEQKKDFEINDSYFY